MLFSSYSTCTKISCSKKINSEKIIDVQFYSIIFWIYTSADICFRLLLSYDFNNYCILRNNLDKQQLKLINLVHNKFFASLFLVALLKLKITKCKSGGHVKDRDKDWIRTKYEELLVFQPKYLQLSSSSGIYISFDQKKLSKQQSP